MDGGNTVVLGNKLAPQEHKMKWQQTSGGRNHLDMMLSQTLIQTKRSLIDDHWIHLLSNEISIPKFSPCVLYVCICIVFYGTDETSPTQRKSLEYATIQ